MLISNQKLKALVGDLDLISKAQLESACKQADDEKKPLAKLLLSKNLIADEQLGQLIAGSLGYDFIDLTKVVINDDDLKIIPEVVARKQKVISFARGKEGIKLAMANPKNLEIISLLEKKTGQKIIPFYTTEKIIKSVLVKYKKEIQQEFSKQLKENIVKLKGGARAEDIPVVKIVDSIINYGYENKASDIHIEPMEEKTLVRFRIDGILHDIVKIPNEYHDLITTRIKIMSKLRTDEHQSAQDGKITTKIEAGEKVDIRVSIVPLTDGEKIVLRLLSEKSRQFGLETLGLSDVNLAKVKKEMVKPYGMILSTGPTGSGKTTSLYSIIKAINRREINISTIEDPVEYDMEGVNQIQVNNKTNLTFAKGLRSILRQDPDIIMVGEIRDEETASIAINAAMTGHLVLSTLHTNDAPTTLPRLIDMKIEPFLIASTVNLIIAQRLVRKICTECVISEKVDMDEIRRKLSETDLEKFFKGRETVRIYRGKGCGVCSNTGYKGRVGIFEILTMSEKIRSLIMNRADADVIRKQAKEEGMQTMIEDGMAKVISGVTSIEELLRATKE
ncbi:type II/IV secretion system protein [Candidatus Parcubacteria bacterium]|nr:MAG: type II/IV secretion system protein [Candidatus Parcubacteria bacterium]